MCPWGSIKFVQYQAMKGVMGVAPDATQQHNKKRKLNDTSEFEAGSIKQVSIPSPPSTQRTMCTSAESLTSDNADKNHVRQLLEPFTVDQLIEILASAYVLM